MSPCPIDDNVDEIVGRYRPDIFEHEPVIELLVELAHDAIHLRPVLAVNEKGGVYHHAVADDLVGPGLVNSGLMRERIVSSSRMRFCAKAFSTSSPRRMRS